MISNNIEPQESVAFNILATLRKRVLNWNYPPRFHLSEKHLCNEFQASRIPVREALQLLAEQGLVDRVPNQGCFVKQPDVEEIYDLYEVRLALELHVGDIVIEKGLNPEWVIEQRSYWQPLLAIKADDPVTADELVEADAKFHLGLAQSTGNLRMVQLLKDCEERLKFVRLASITSAHRFQETAGEHLAIIDAILFGNAKEVRRTLRQNISHARNKAELALSRAIMASHRRPR
jgi:DNA-binding GntR family transcriptional regulator